MSEPTIPTPPVSLQEQANFQRLSWPLDAQDAVDLQEDLDAAIETVEKLCGPVSVAARSYLCRPRRDKLVLPVTRVTAVLEITDPDGNTVTPYDVNLAAGIIELSSEPWSTKAWTVLATTGQDRKALVLAIKQVASHLYGIRRGSAALPGGRSYPTTDTETVSLAGFAIPRRSADLMAPYLRTGR